MICPKCDKWIPDGSRRCPGCGTLLRKYVDTENNAENKNEAHLDAEHGNEKNNSFNQQNFNKRNISVLIAASLVIIIFVIGISSFIILKTDKNTVTMPFEEVETFAEAESESLGWEKDAPINENDLIIKISQLFNYRMEGIVKGYFDGSNKYIVETLCADDNNYQNLMVVLKVDLTYTFVNGGWVYESSNVEFDHIENLYCLLGEWKFIDSSGCYYANVTEITKDRIVIDYKLYNLSGRLDCGYDIWYSSSELLIDISEPVPDAPKGYGFTFVFRKDPSGQFTGGDSGLRYGEIGNLYKLTATDPKLSDFELDAWKLRIANDYNLKNCELIGEGFGYAKNEYNVVIEGVNTIDYDITSIRERYIVTYKNNNGNLEYDRIYKDGISLEKTDFLLGEWETTDYATGEYYYLNIEEISASNISFEYNIEGLKEEASLNYSVYSSKIGDYDAVIISIIAYYDSSYSIVFALYKNELTQTSSWYVTNDWENYIKLSPVS